MATIQDVAKLANVSAMTVSRVINKKESVSEETCRRVMRAVEELQYIPNITARNLVTRKSMSIAVMVTTIANPYFSRVMLGAESVAEMRGYSVLLVNASQQEKYQQHLENLVSNGVEGLITSHLNLKSSHIEFLKQYNIKCVLVDNEQQIEGVYNMQSDHYYGACAAVEHLLELGHQRIALIHGALGYGRGEVDTGEEESYSFRLWRQRYEGYADTLRNNSIPFREDYIVYSDSNYERNVVSGMEAMGKLLRLKTPPTALYAGNDLFAIGALHAALHHGVKVPGDLSIIGHGGVDATKYTFPELTCIKQPRFTIGARAAQKLIDLIEAPEAHIASQANAFEVIRPQLMPGQSTAPPNRS